MRAARALAEQTVVLARQSLSWSPIRYIPKYHHFYYVEGVGRMLKY